LKHISRRFEQLRRLDARETCERSAPQAAISAKSEGEGVLVVRLVALFLLEHPRVGIE
jgi:hypothetical protein